ncbi:hypothetical protein FHR70_002062 [Microvirga lupini]|uniref:Uncharacterized protein n=1 Tax=Microvirga lupini TaxID=420324 RepID=A0A7W4VKR3_9HYPH|nr:hypothetical protein [Microvirga lupini]MBB3019008.1 hypothetical protein [Microvirga lupini]
MIKSLTVLTAALTAGLLVASEANAGLSFNGRGLNGRGLNGVAREGAVAGQGAQATSIILKDGARVTLK